MSVSRFCISIQVQCLHHEMTGQNNALKHNDCTYQVGITKCFLNEKARHTIMFFFLMMSPRFCNNMFVFEVSTSNVPATYISNKFQDSCTTSQTNLARHNWCNNGYYVWTDGEKYVPRLRLLMPISWTPSIFSTRSNSRSSWT